MPAVIKKTEMMKGPFTWSKFQLARCIRVSWPCSTSSLDASCDGSIGDVDVTDVVCDVSLYDDVTFGSVVVTAISRILRIKLASLMVSGSCFCIDSNKDCECLYTTSFSL